MDRRDRCRNAQGRSRSTIRHDHRSKNEWDVERILCRDEAQPERVWGKVFNEHIFTSKR